MGLRPAKCYRKIDTPAYTRTAIRKMSKAFVRGIPGSKIRVFNTGNIKGNYGLKAYLISKFPLNIRHNQLEAARVAANQYATKLLGVDGYYLQVLVYPHQIMRENPLATGAGADRFQSGMSRSFGKPIGVAARVIKNSRLMVLSVPTGKEEVAKEAFKRAAIKLSARTRVEIKKGSGITGVG